MAEYADEFHFLRCERQLHISYDSEKSRRVICNKTLSVRCKVDAQVIAFEMKNLPSLQEIFCSILCP